MEKKFKAGDFARRKSNGKIVKITLEDYGWVAYQEKILTSGACPMEDVEPVDPKIAFLSELKGLLERYEASIMIDAKGSYCGDDVESVTMSLCFNNEHIDYTIADFDKEIAADNIMDYDKE